MKGTSRIQLALFVLVVVLAAPLGAFGADGQIKLTQPASFPIVINNPGSYVLTSDLVVSTLDVDCISIQADNVTIDLNGHSLIGPGKTSGTSGAGITSSPTSSIAITNGTVRDFSGGGIAIGSSQSNIIKDIRAYNNGSDGISAYSVTITNCVASNNGDDGIIVTAGTVLNCTAYGNGGSGFLVNSGTVTNCTAEYNSGDGFEAEDMSTITNCTAILNQLSGIHAGNDCRIEGNNLSPNFGYGLHLHGTANYAIKNVARNGMGNFQDNNPGANYMPTTGDNANYGF